MEHKLKKIKFGNSGGFGALKNIDISSRLGRINEGVLQSGPQAEYRISEEARNHLLEMEYQKNRARVEAQRFQLNR